MKKPLLFVILILISFACEKDYLIPSDEVPGWLNEDIKRNEKIIQDSPGLMNSYGAWIRYSWQNEYYFEYHNELSSSMPRPISFDRDTLHLYANDASTDYFKEKCCRLYVWKGPDYTEFIR